MIKKKKLFQLWLANENAKSLKRNQAVKAGGAFNGKKYGSVCGIERCSVRASGVIKGGFSKWLKTMPVDFMKAVSKVSF
ncbi:MAG: hypothetical protein QM725_10550 [Lacibacter sp.]